VRSQEDLTHLVCDVIEEGGLVGGFKVFDGVVVFEDAAGRDGQDGELCGW
jgi:hypothetical protein